ncbi:MAG: class I SAM-dependent methyltransferase [Dehalococcoidia bacterium]
MAFIVSNEIEQYAARHTSALPPLLEELTRATYESMQAPQMLSGQLEGTLLQFLVALTGAKNVLEIGMFTGFSAQMMAAALPDDGRLITCEIDPKTRDFAARFFQRSPHGKKIEVRLGPALETLKTLDGPFDLVFIDADKGNYIAYYERSLELLSPNGVIAVDNVLWSGRVLDPKDESDRAIAAFNEHVTRDPRVQNVILTVRDGVMLIRKV